MGKHGKFRPYMTLLASERWDMLGQGPRPFPAATALVGTPERPDVDPRPCPWLQTPRDWWNWRNLGTWDTGIRVISMYFSISNG